MVDNSQIDDKGVDYVYDARVKYTCNDGYRFVGSAEDTISLTCDENGSWGEAPQCESECFLI